MPKKLFGTDGIRGVAGGLLTPGLAMRAGYGLAKVLVRRIKQPTKRPAIVVCRDCRLSSPMLMQALASGVTAGGADVWDLGIAPTPLVPFAVRKLKAKAGVMITASHNPVADNGLKFFGGNGIKILPGDERRIETAILGSKPITGTPKGGFGDVNRVDIEADYLKFLSRSVKASGNGKTLKVVLDCAYGATAGLAPRAFVNGGFEVVAICAKFDGNKINVNCGATNLVLLSRAVKRHKANLGLAFDGDGDRVLAIDEQGNTVNGDKIIALLATRLPRYKRQGSVVMTKMTNMGIEQGLRQQGVKMLRTEVGDINVLKAMLKAKLNLGGEQSGHIIMADKLPGGDGIHAGLQLAALVRSSKSPLSDMVGEYVEFPQQLTNLTVRDKSAWLRDKAFQKQLGNIRSDYQSVRFYLRPSGTENLVRVLTESQDADQCRRGNRAVCQAFRELDKK